MSSVGCMRDGGTILRPVQRGSAGECIFNLGAKIRLRILRQRAEVRVGTSIDAKLRDALLQASKKFVVNGSFNVCTLHCDAYASGSSKRRRR